MKRWAPLLLPLALASRREEPGPVTRVVSLLEDLKARIETDGERDQAAYDKFACWCETTTDKKAQAITAVRESLTKTGNTILQLKGKVATLVSETKQMITDVKENEENQMTATTVREKENKAFKAEKIELEQATAALAKAIEVLSGATALSQEAATSVQHAHAVVGRAPDWARPGPKKMAELESKAKLLKTAAKQGGKYTPQSGTVQGILHEMFSSFTNNMETLVTEEGKKARNYETLMSTWHEELVQLRKAITKKEASKAESETMLADAMQGYQDQEAQLKADADFFDVTKESCLAKTDEWTSRKTMRTEELEGIDKALEVLTSDDAKELFGKAIKKPAEASFLQLRSDGKLALKLARNLLLKSGDLRLTALATSMVGGHFDEVIVSIDGLLETLAQEEQDDIKKVDECKKDLTDTASKTKDLKWKIEKSTAHLEKLNTAKTEAEDEKTQVLDDIQAAEDAITEAKSMRETENSEFLAAKADDEAAIILLKEAKEALMKYHKDASFLELGKNNTPPETKFAAGDSRKTETKGIVGLMDVIIENLEKEIEDGKKAEEAAQLDHEKAVAISEALVEKLKEREVNLDTEISDKETAIGNEEESKTGHETDLTSEEETEAAMKPECDWFIEHQNERREKRAAEVDGLKRAKELLAGARPPELVQKASFLRGPPGPVARGPPGPPR